MNRPFKFRFWCPAAKTFVQDYNYNGSVDELFEDNILIAQQYIGIKDKDGKEIYEGDIVEYIIEGIDGTTETHCEGEVFWNETIAAFCFCMEFDFTLRDGIIPKSLKVIGHIHQEQSS